MCSSFLLSRKGVRRVGVREGFGDAVLLALNMVEGATSQGMQADSGSGKASK